MLVCEVARILEPKSKRFIPLKCNPFNYIYKKKRKKKQDTGSINEGIVLSFHHFNQSRCLLNSELLTVVMTPDGRLGEMRNVDAQPDKQSSLELE